MTWAAVASGAAAATFGIGLGTTLHRAYADTSQNASLPVRVTASSHGLGPLTVSQRHAVTTTLAAQPGTLGYAAMTQAELSLPGLAQRLDVIAYGSPLGRSGLALIAGRSRHLA